MTGRALALVVTAAIVLGACGGDSGGTVNAGIGTINVDLTVKVTAGSRALRTGALKCGSLGAIGTNYLAGTAATTACALLAHDGAPSSRLVDGPPRGVFCNDIYGGPEVATVTGTLRGRAVAARVTRANGCGTADWTMLQPLLGPPES